jgi:hypothetical protein
MIIVVNNAPPELLNKAADAIEAAWGIIANAGGGDWTKETPEWQAAATRWRDEYITTPSVVLEPEAECAECNGACPCCNDALEIEAEALADSEDEDDVFDCNACNPTCNGECCEPEAACQCGSCK